MLLLLLLGLDPREENCQFECRICELSGRAHPVALYLGETLLFGAQAREVFCHCCDLPCKVCRRRRVARGKARHGSRGRGLRGAC